MAMDLITKQDGPIVAINQPKLREQQQRHITRRRADAAEIRASIFKLPPTNVRHPIKFDLRRQKSNRRALYKTICRKLCIRIILQPALTIDVERKPIKRAVVILFGNQQRALFILDILRR